MSFDITTLITDRTAEDVEYVNSLREKLLQGTATASEVAEWLKADLKGAYNVSDLDRVNAAVVHLHARCNKLGYRVLITPQPNWTDADTPTDEQLQSYLSNVEALREVLRIQGNIPMDMVGFRYQEANELERILVEVDTMLKNIIASFVYCGQPYCGQIWEDFT